MQNNSMNPLSTPDVVDPDSVEKAKFMLFLTKLLISGISTKQIAERLDISIPTVKRWMYGYNFPMPGMRAIVYKEFEGCGVVQNKE